MKIKFLVFAANAITVCAILFSACYQTKPKINDINPAFGKYISGYTSGMQSRKATIRIELSSGLNDVKVAALAARMDSLKVVAETTNNPELLHNFMS